MGAAQQVGAGQSIRPASAKRDSAPVTEFERPQAGDVGKPDQQRGAALADAQPAHQCRLAVACAVVRAQFGHQFGEGGVGPWSRKALQTCRLGQIRQWVKNGLLPNIASSRGRSLASFIAARTNRASSGSLPFRGRIEPAFVVAGDRFLIGGTRRNVGGG